MIWDTIIIVDWSGGNDRGAKPCADAIWVGVYQDGRPQDPRYFRNRQVFETWMSAFLDDALREQRRVFAGFDFPFGYPEGFAAHVTGRDDPFALWEWYCTKVHDAPQANNRFDIAGEMNGTLPGIGPFWANGLKRDIANLPRKSKARTTNPFAERRAVEKRVSGTFTCWQLAGAGAVGSQIMMGLPVLQRLRRKFLNKISVWPFENIDKPIAFFEVWPSLQPQTPPVGMIKDAYQVMSTAQIIATSSVTKLHTDLRVTAPVEGWIFGVTQPQVSP